MNPPARPRTRRHSQGNGPGAFLWSLAIHVWFAGLAMTLVWRVWWGYEEVAQPALLEPSDGGERSSSLAMKPLEKSNVQAMKSLEKKLHTKLPAEISLTTRVKPLAAFDPVSRPYVPGGGWNGGVGRSLLGGQGGDGYGPGSGVGFIGKCITVPSRRGTFGLTQTVQPRLAVVLDVSGSMKADSGGANSPALREFIHVLSMLPANGLFSVVCFSDEAALFRGESLAITADNTAAAVEWAREKFRRPRSGDVLPVPEGTSGTSRLDLGITAALEGSPTEVLLISDGCPVVRDGLRSLPHGAILARISAGLPSRREAPLIHAIATNSRGSGFLRRLAAEFSGNYRSAAGD